VILLALLAAADKTGGCEQLNRMGISPDGNSIAFSLNGKGGFGVDETSALYKLDLTDCHLTRVSADKPLATWADINSKGDVLFTWRSKETGDCTEVAVARVNGKVEELTRNVISDGVPQWLDSDRVLLATTPPLKPNGDKGDEYDVFLSVADLKPVAPAEADKGPKRTDVVHEVYAWESHSRAYWSTLPVWTGNQLAYAAADLVKEEGGDKVAMTCRFYLVDLESRERREVGSVTFQEEQDAKEPPVGYVDLAVSPDGKKLAACFLPADFEKDDQPSQLYLIDLTTAKAELVKEDVNMYYPRFAPKAEGEPYRLLYLSGTGEGGKGRSINILNLETKQARKLISLPGVIMTAYTDWRWLSELTGADDNTPRNRLRVYHLGDLGLIVAELNDDGSNLSIRYLDASRLRLAQVEADLRWAQSVAEGAAGQVEAGEKAQAEAKKLVSGPVEFLRVETVPQAAVTEGKSE
jgi:hypothetical protein